MTEEQIKQFPTSAEEYFYKKVKDGLPWKAEVYRFFEVIKFYRKATKKLQEKNLKLESKIKHMTKHLEPQTMTASFEQVEEEWGKEQRIKELEEENTELKEQVEKMKKCAICIDRNTSCIDCVNKSKFRLDLHIEDSETEENEKAKKIISELCRSIRFLNSNDNTKLTNVDVFLKDAEDFIK